MTGRLIIDGTDVFTAYGAYILRGGYNGLLQWPATKAVDSVAWQEYDYAEVDLSALRLEAKEFDISFGLRCALDDTADFYDWLAASVYRHWNFAEIGVEKDLRLVAMSGIQTAGTVHIVSIRVAEDTPFGDYTYVAPSSSLSPLGLYTIDGTDISTYGVRVLNGTPDSTARSSDIKELLKRNISTVDGVIYDAAAQNNTRKTREVTLKCAITDATAGNMVRNYNALLYDLIRPDMTASVETNRCRRSLYSTALGKGVYCYYKNQSVTDVLTGYGKNMILFNITLTIIGEL